MMEDKIQKLFSDEKILKEFLEQKDIEDAKKFLENRGIEISKEELKDVAKLLNEYAKKGNNIKEETLDKIVGGKLNRRTANNKSDKYTNRALVNFLVKALPLGMTAGITGAIAAIGDDEELGGPGVRNVLIGTSIATGALAIKNIVSGVKDAHNACWWSYIADNVD